MRIITNNKNPTHLTIVKRLVKNSDELIICVAFLKSSGLMKIAKLLPKNSTFYIGTDFYITEPQALKRLIRSGHTVYLTKKAKATFHPKIYYSLKGGNISILTGSANITGGGLETNLEVSVLFQTETDSSIDKDFKKLIELYKTHSTKITGELQLSQYERKFEAYRKKHKKADKEFKEENSKIHELDLTKLNKYVKEYLNADGLASFSERVEYYKTAKKLLNSLTRNGITSAEDFLHYYEDIASSFHSSGLLRGKTIFAKKHKSIIEVIRLIKTNKNKSPKYVFLKTLPIVKSIKRFGVNALTEIMNTYNPNKFSVANGRTLNSLKDLGFAKFPKANSFDADTYEKYNDLITEIAIACNFKDLGQVDHFLSWYYDRYVKE